MMNFSLTRALARRRASLVAAVLVACAALPLFAHTATRPAAITVANNSSLEIRHLYVSPPDSDNWGPDQLNNSSIREGETFTLSVACSQSDVKLIAEDSNGCFVSQVVSCADGTTWTIAAGTTPNCGGN